MPQVKGSNNKLILPIQVILFNYHQLHIHIHHEIEIKYVNSHKKFPLKQH